MKGDDHPWLSWTTITEIAPQVQAAKLVKRGHRTHSDDERAVTRRVWRPYAFYKARLFFQVVAKSSKSEFLYLKQE